MAENRRRLAAALGVDKLTIADQQHTARVAVVDAALAGRGHDGVPDSVAAFPATDAMITDLPGIALAILVADCAPVVVYDPVRRAIGVAHSGRVGTVIGMLPNTVEAMSQAFGSAPGDLLVGIGPAIRADSYEIGDAEAAEVTAAFGPDRAGLLIANRPGHCTLRSAGRDCASSSARPGSRPPTSTTWASTPGPPPTNSSPTAPRARPAASRPSGCSPP